MSDHLIAEAHRHAMALPTTHPTHADIAWYVREVSELRAEVKESKERERVAIASWDEERQRALREGGRVVELRAEVERLGRSEREARGSERDLRQILDTYVGVEARAESAERDVARLRGYSDELDGVTNALGDALARAERAEGEVKMLGVWREGVIEDAWAHKANLEGAIARAERAEAELATVKMELDQVACARTDGILRESDLQCRLNMERKQFNKIKTALTDAISTYFGEDKLVTAERIEAWQAALKEETK